MPASAIPIGKARVGKCLRCTTCPARNQSGTQSRFTYHSIVRNENANRTALAANRKVLLNGEPPWLGFVSCSNPKRGGRGLPRKKDPLASTHRRAKLRYPTAEPNPPALSITHTRHSHSHSHSLLGLCGFCMFRQAALKHAGRVLGMHEIPPRRARCCAALQMQQKVKIGKRVAPDCQEQVHSGGQDIADYVSCTRSQSLSPRNARVCACVCVPVCAFEEGKETAIHSDLAATRSCVFRKGFSGRSGPTKRLCRLQRRFAVKRDTHTIRDTPLDTQPCCWPGSDYLGVFRQACSSRSPPKQVRRRLCHCARFRSGWVPALASWNLLLLAAAAGGVGSVGGQRRLDAQLPMIRRSCTGLPACPRALLPVTTLTQTLANLAAVQRALLRVHARPVTSSPFPVSAPTELCLWSCLCALCLLR